MAIARGEKDYLGFVQGLHTEANPLAAPEGTTSDELNMELALESGTRARRLGLSSVSGDLTYQPDEIDTSVGYFITLQGFYYWESKEKYVAVVRYRKPNTEVASTIQVLNSDFTVDYEFIVDTPDDIQPTFTEIRTRLVITLGTAPLVVEQTATSYDVYVISMYVRDFTLVDDDLTIGERPISLSDEHKYNLYNAGWWKDRALEGSTKGDPVDKFFTDLAVYPSNADIVYLGDIVNQTSGLEEFDPDALDNIDLGSSEAPRGHYVYNIRDITRSAKLSNKTNDGAVGSSVTKIVEDGADTGEGGGTGGSTWEDPALPPGTEIP